MVPAPPRSAARHAWPAALIVLAIAVPWLLLAHWAQWSHISVAGRWPLIERFDIRVYFASSRAFADGRGVFGSLQNEYPFVANLVFDAVAGLSHLLHPLAQPLESFTWMWVTLMWWVYLGVFWLLRRSGTAIAWLLWLSPAAFHFTLSRFDALPVLATLLALLALRRDRILSASLWFGLAIALKAYAIVLLPCYAVYVLARRNWYRACLECGIVLAPFALAHLVVYVCAGREVMEAPYRLLAHHHLNGESVWDAIALLTGADTRGWLARYPSLPRWLVLAAGVAPALSWPQTFEDFAEAALAALLGSILVLDFQSPQYVLWGLPFVAFARHRREQWLFLLHSLAVFCYFPIAFQMRGRRAGVWHASIILAHVTRIVLMAAVYHRRFARRRVSDGVVEP